MNDLWSEHQLLELPSAIPLIGQRQGYNEIALLDWASKSAMFEKPILRTINFVNQNFSRVTVAIKSEESHLNGVSGCGRNQDLTSALSKAYGECLERKVAYEAQNERDFSSHHQLEWNTSEILIRPATKKAAMPPKKIRTTNGWAVHFNRDEAIRNALNEAIERHLLLLSYFKYGWSGFEIADPIEWDGLRIFSMAARCSMPPFRAGLVATKSKNLPGYTFGYFCDFDEHFSNSGKWIHAMMEAFEPAKYYEDKSPLNVKEKLSAVLDPMDRTQIKYLLDQTDLTRLCYPNDGSQFLVYNSPTDIASNLAVVNVGARMKLGVEFYAAFVYGGALIPLVFKDHMDTESRGYVEQILSKHSILEQPDVHPIL